MKRLAKVLALLVVSATLLTSVVGCSSPTSPDAGQTSDGNSEPVVLKLGHIQTQEDLWQLGAEKFAELVEEKSNGEVKIEIYPNSTLGNDRDRAEGLQMGSVDFALIAGVLGNFEPSLQIMELPYLFRDEEHLRKVIYGPVGEELMDKLLTNANIRGLAFWERGPRQLTSNKPINAVEDIQGLKIRVPEIPPMVAAWKAMGANPTPMAWGEVYTALQQKVVDAQENPIPYIHAGHIYEVQKYIAMTNHKYEYVILAMSDATYNKLTPEQQQIVEEAAQEATEYENKLVAEKADTLLAEMKEQGVEVTNPDTEEFAKLARTVHAEFAQKYGQDIYDKIINTK